MGSDKVNQFVLLHAHGEPLKSFSVRIARNPICVSEGLLSGHRVEDVSRGGQSEGRDPLSRIISVILAKGGGGLGSQGRWTEG